MRKFLLSLLMIILILSLVSCSNNNFGASQSPQAPSNSDNISFKVCYYDENTREYTATKTDKYIQCDFLAPAGKAIKGIYDQNGVQYADYSCKIMLGKSSTIPSTLYARYEDVDISYLDNDPFTALDEAPKQISFYRTQSFTWKFDPVEYPDDEKMLAACLCNPYSDLTITVSFMAKGDGTRAYNSNTFQSKLKVCDETIGEFSADNLGDSYTKYEYSGKIKALQLTNGNYEVTVLNSSTLGYEDFYIKNVRVDFSFDFSTADN